MTADKKSRILSYAASLWLLVALATAVALHKPPFWAMAAGVAGAWICATVRIKLVSSKLNATGNAADSAGAIGNHDIGANLSEMEFNGGDADRLASPGTHEMPSPNSSDISSIKSDISYGKSPGPDSKKAPPNVILSAALSGVSRTANVMILVALVNAMTAVWFTSGTIQGLMYYGLQIVNPKFLTLAGLLLSTLLCTLIGSSVGTVATIGVAIVGIARAFGIPAAPVAGAIMSGAIFGDRVSFLSPIYHLAVDMTGSDHRKATKRILATGIPALIACAALYGALGYFVGPEQGMEGALWGAEFLTALQETAKITPWVLLPTAAVIFLAVLRVPVRSCLAAGLASAGIIAVCYQGAPLVSVLRAATLGYSPQGAPAEIATLLRSGGVMGTANMLLLLVFAAMYTGIMDASGMMGDVSSGFVSRLNGRQSFLSGAMMLSVLSAALASNQAMSVIIPAGAMEAKRQELGVSREDFAGALSDSGVVAAGIIPWNVMAAMCSASLQVPVIQYAPFTLLMLMLPVAGLWYSWRTDRSSRVATG